eukprot:3019088-Rhodomonas_salina.2
MGPPKGSYVLLSPPSAASAVQVACGSCVSELGRQRAEEQRRAVRGGVQCGRPVCAAMCSQGELLVNAFF